MGKSEKFGKKLRVVWSVKFFEGGKLVSKRFNGKDAEEKAKAFAEQHPAAAWVHKRNLYRWANLEVVSGYYPPREDRA